MWHLLGHDLEFEFYRGCQGVGSSRFFRLTVATAGAWGVEDTRFYSLVRPWKQMHERGSCNQENRTRDEQPVVGSTLGVL
ncbi:unnamed protein product, partial [Gulo gulo]